MLGIKCLLDSKQSIFRFNYRQNRIGAKTNKKESAFETSKALSFCLSKESGINRFLLLKPEIIARVTTFAVGEIFAESGFIVVTGRAARAGFRRFVHGDRRHVHFAARCRVTVIAFEETVFRMAEIAGNKRARRRDVVRSVDLMAGETFAARKTAAAFHRRVALETGFMRRFAVRNGKADAAAARFVTGRAIFFRVVGVIEPDAEAARVRYFYMAFAAIRKIVCAESSLVIVASRAAVRRARVHSDRNLRAAARAVTVRAV